jgi:hypothetical protein
MPLAKLITHKRINVLGGFCGKGQVFRLALVLLLTALNISAFSQDNSPYTRYALGDLVPSTNIIGRGMGGLSAGNTDIYGLTINYNNPATFSLFQAIREQNSKKMTSGRAVLDVGINLESRTLKEPNNVGKFTASNFLFSHVQVGVPLRPNWGLSFGLRPVSRISYKVLTRERLFDPNTNLPIDTALTLNEGDGGTYLASMGTGWAIKLGEGRALSFGISGGYMFGKKQINVRRSLFNDSLPYIAANYQTNTTYGNLTASAGVQFQSRLKEDLFLSIGAYGNLKHTLNASQDIVRETFVFNETTGNTRLDSVRDIRDIKGDIIWPSSYTAGFVLERTPGQRKSGWLVGVDFTQMNWGDDYRFYGQKDTAVTNKWEMRVGAQLRPSPKSNYFSNVAYRAGFFIGRDYVHVKEDLPLLGVTLGLGLPLRNFNRQSQYQHTVINLAFEFVKRGNNDNLLKENLFRLSTGFSLSDLWFIRRKYE